MCYRLPIPAGIWCHLIQFSGRRLMSRVTLLWRHRWPFLSAAPLCRIARKESTRKLHRMPAPSPHSNGDYLLSIQLQLANSSAVSSNLSRRSNIIPWVYLQAQGTELICGICGKIREMSNNFCSEINISGIPEFDCQNFVVVFFCGVSVGLSRCRSGLPLPVVGALVTAASDHVGQRSGIPETIQFCLAGFRRPVLPKFSLNLTERGTPKPGTARGRLRWREDGREK